MTVNAGGKGPSDAAGPPGVGAFSWTLKASGVADSGAPEPDGWGRVLGGRRIVAAGGVEVEGLDRTVGTVRVGVPGGGATRGGCAPGLAG